MRVCKADLLYALTRSPLSSTIVLHLPGQRVEHLASGLLECPSLLCVRLDDNNVTAIAADELEGCPGLYEVGLRNNSLRKVEGLKAYRVFGR